jgi:hypothetical protein
MDRLLGKFEQKGFVAANFFHRFAINVMLLGCGYLFISSLRDYNAMKLEQFVG